MKNAGIVAFAAAALLSTAMAAAQNSSPAPGPGASRGMGMMQGQPGMRGRGMGMGRGRMMNFSRLRHRYVRVNGFDSKYAPMRNTQLPTKENIEDGKSLYATHCASCHGAGGAGDGIAGKALNPPPADIATFARTTMATDPYLVWTVSEGGRPIGSAMPAFGKVLKKEDIWNIVLYLRQMQP